MAEGTTITRFLGATNVTFDRLIRLIIQLSSIRERMPTQSVQDSRDWVTLTEVQTYLEVLLEKMERE